MKPWMWFVLIIYFAEVAFYGVTHSVDGGNQYLFWLGTWMDAGIILGFGIKEWLDFLTR
jgi:hypothetical protein